MSQGKGEVGRRSSTAVSYTLDTENIVKRTGQYTFRPFGRSIPVRFAFLITTDGPFGLDLDLVNGKIYWAKQSGAIGTRRIERANLDGSGVEILVTGNDPQGVAVDPGADAMLWSDQGTSTIQTSDLDGNGTQDLHTGLSSPGGIDLGSVGAGAVPNGADVVGTPLRLGKGVGDQLDFTWSASCVATDTDYAIYQGRLGDSTSHLSLQCSTLGLTMASIEPREGLFWTEKTLGAVRRSDLDGTDSADVRTGLSEPLTVTVAGSKVYWVATSGTIERSDFDGSNLELLASELNVPRGVAVDLDSAKIYWSEVGKIVIADLDGSNPMDFITGLSTPLEMEIDADGGFMYWSDSGQDTIYRADYPSGGSVTPLITTDGPFGLDLDLVNGKIYWAKQSGPIGTRRIGRANLDGSGAEILVTGNDPQGVAVDPHGNAMFWSDQGTSTIQTADLDGNNVRDLLTGLSSLGGIDIDQSQRVYYLVVPTNGTSEGSYGVDSSGAARSQGQTVCALQSIRPCP